MKKTIAFLALYLFGFLPVEAQKDNQEKTYAVDTVASEILWFCGRHYGCVRLDTGSIEVVNNEIVNGSFIIDLNTVEDDDITDNRLLRLTLNNVIKSLPFFNVEAFPYSKFRIEDVEKIEDNYYHLNGNLEIHDVERSIDFYSKIIIRDERIMVESGIIDIDRTNWGVTYLSEKYDPEGKESMYVPDIISLRVHLFADKIKKKKK